MSLKNKIHLILAKHIINDKEYRINRMKQMTDNLIYWDNKEKLHSKLTIEKDYCKKMQDMYFKRFQWYKNHFAT